MARTKKQGTLPISGDVPKGKKAFDPASLSKGEQALVVEHYLGVHPKYFVYEGLKVNVDIWNMEYDKKHFNGWKPQLEEQSS